MNHRIKRRSADYFQRLPSADPMASQGSATPQVSSESAPPSEGPRGELGGEGAAVRALWTGVDAVVQNGEPISMAGVPSPPGTWKHLTDPEVDEAAEKAAGGAGEAPGGKGRLHPRSWLSTLVGARAENTADDPFQLLAEAQGRSVQDMWLPVGNWSVIDEHDGDLGLLRRLGLGLEQQKMMEKGVRNPDPVFTTKRVEGVLASEMPLPGTSVAVLGVRGGFGREQVTHVRIEEDQLWRDRGDLRHATGATDPTRAPLDAKRARRMRHGERYRIQAEKTVLAEAGLKYTATPIPGPAWLSLAVGTVADLGPSVQGDFTVAVQGATDIEITRGPRSKVAVSILASDKRANPGDDRKWRASVGAFFDSTLFEYAARAFRRLAGSNVEAELQDLADQKRYADERILANADRFNDSAWLGREKHTRKRSDAAVLYELVFDLARPEARAIFDRLMGSEGDERVIDFQAIAALPPESGVQLVTNNVRKASRTALERTWAAFGLRTSEAEIVERSETRHGEHGRVLEETHGLSHTRKGRSSLVHSTTVGRVRTVHDERTGEQRTAVGFGWRYGVDYEGANATQLAGLWSFAAIAGAEPEGRERLVALQEDFKDPKPRARGEFSIELNGEAVDRLLDLAQDEAGAGLLWKALADAYALRRGIDAPAWPVPELTDPGWLTTLRERAGLLKPDRAAFLVAHRAVETLRSARGADPIEAAKQIASAFDLLRNDLDLAAALVAAARGPDDSGVRVDVRVQAESGRRSPDPLAPWAGQLATVT